MTDSATAGLRVYIVGGAVRDELLGLPAGDRDWVVVGATPQQMVARGFLPVGEDFPVFLHPVTREEYALARTERKSGRGYKGFTFYTGTDVTLEQDLRRRDLTVNAIAREPEGALVDPLHGVADLRQHVLRHVGPAFAEDPVRILRLARFAARFAAFSVAPQTLALCRAMVAAGEADALVPERVWKEVARGLMTAAPARMLEVMEQTESLPRVMPGLEVTARVRGALDAAAHAGLPLASRYALMCLDSSGARAALAARMRVPSECADYARLLPEVLQGLDVVREAAGDLPARAEAMLLLLERCDAIRKPDRFIALLQAVALLTPVDTAAWGLALQAVRGVDAGAIARACQGDAGRIKPAVRAARLQALQPRG